MKTEYRIQLWHQVLYEGTWEDGCWDWEYETIKYGDEETAQKMYEKVKEESDAEVIRLYKVYLDEYDCVVDEYLIDSTDF